MNLFKHIEFNIFGLIIMVVLLTPNILFAFLKKQDHKTYKPALGLSIMEQIGRYGSMLFMIVTISWNEVSEKAMIINIIVTSFLTVFYVWTWRAYYMKEGKTLAVALAVLPALIFVVSGILSKHVLLILVSIIFLISHLKITLESYKTSQS